MIIRVVKMHFQPETTAQFEELFAARKERIRHQPGCLHLELWKDTSHPEVYFTYSHWADAAALQRYRDSEFFKETWQSTRRLFAQKAEAYSVEAKQVLP